MRTSGVEPRDRARALAEQGARAIELHWPSLVVGAACAGIAAANWVGVGTASLIAVALSALLGVALLDGPARVASLGLAVAIVGLGWGSLRLDARGQSVLAAEAGVSGDAQLVVTGTARRTSWAIRVPAELRAFRGARVRERVLLVLPVGRSPPRGAILATVGRITEPREPEGGFDERTWLARQGIHVLFRAGPWRQVGRRGGVGGLGDRLREAVIRAVGRGTDGIRRGLVLGVVLGEDEGLPRDVQDAFRASGLYHLLAVSGQNVAFIAGGIYGLCWLLRLPRILRELLAIGAIAAYVLAVGWQPSVVRAGVAGVLVCLAWLVARPRDRWHFLALGALVLLVWAPTSLFEPGFQLSFAAVAAIFLGVPRARRLADRYALPRGLADALAVSLVCGLATAPILLTHFDRAPVYTVPANAAAFFAMPLVLGLGLLAAAADPVSQEAATALAWLAGWAAAWIALVARVAASLPGAEIGARGALAAAGAAAVAAAGIRAGKPLLRGREPGLAVAVCGLALVAAVGWWATRPEPEWQAPAGLRVTFLDVGQGDSVLLETPSARVLVDQGPPEADVAGQLARMGVRALSALVLTHPQRDHVGGAADIIRRFAVGTLLDPGLEATGPEHAEAIAAARERRVPIRELRAGAVLRAGGLVLRALWPVDGGLPSEDPNLNAVVLLASFGDADVFLPADAESDVTGRLEVDDVEVLKVAHHGSADPGLASQLEELAPEIAVVSAGRDNPYGHPTAETLAALSAVPGLAVFRTDEDGRVVVESDGARLLIRTEG